MLCAKLNTAIEIFLELIKDENLKKKVRENMYLGGGCIYCIANNKEPKDYDIFIKNKDVINELEKLSFWKCKTEYALSYGKYQVVIKFYGEPEDVVSQFDFKHNMFWYEPGSENIKNLAPLKYLHTNELIFNEERARDIANVVLRIQKFLDRGMTISDETMKLIKSRTSDEEVAKVKKYYDNRRNANRETWHSPDRSEFY